MGAKVEGFVKQYESKVQETTAAIEKLSDADWKKVTAEEKWPVGQPIPAEVERPAEQVGGRGHVRSK